VVEEFMATLSPLASGWLEASIGEAEMTYAWINPEGMWLTVGIVKGRIGNETSVGLTDRLNEAAVLHALPKEANGMHLTPVPACVMRKVILGET
jgi:hypothetical protein